VVVHLAAYYDFTGEDHPEYWRTNVDGLRNVLEECRELAPFRFVLASSVAACEFPRPGEALTESSPPDAAVTYAATKRLGEEMLAEYRNSFPSTIVRFAALFSDWCEYHPLFVFFETWLSAIWNRRVLGGRGEFGVPYLHVRDAASFIGRVLERFDRFEPEAVLIASTDGSVTVRELFEEVTHYYFGARDRPLILPKSVCWVGMHAMDMVGRITGNRPFERPWMARYIDRQLTVDASRTRERLGWAPRERLEIRRRLPFLIENLRADPVEWQRRNRAAMKGVRFAVNLQIHRLLERNEDAIISEVVARMMGKKGPKGRFDTFQRTMPEDDLEWAVRLSLGQLKNAIRAGDKGLFMSYARDLAERRFEQGFRSDEVCDALRLLLAECLKSLTTDPEAQHLDSRTLDRHLSMTVLFGSDQVHDTFELLEKAEGRAEEGEGEQV
jgi:nucleoside-diphosphate-sugar epimerase